MGSQAAGCESARVVKIILRIARFLTIESIPRHREAGLKGRDKCSVNAPVGGEVLNEWRTTSEFSGFGFPASLSESLLFSLSEQGPLAGIDQSSPGTLGMVDG